MSANVDPLKVGGQEMRITSVKAHWVQIPICMISEEAFAPILFAGKDPRDIIRLIAVPERRGLGIAAREDFLTAHAAAVAR